jgi:predicted nucleotide-binding protein
MSSNLPKTDSIEELARFWDTHEITEFNDQVEEVCNPVFRRPSNQSAKTRIPRPSIFVGSSTEGLRIAQAVQLLLDRVGEVEIWSQGVFGLGHGTLESLVLAVGRFDFAIFALTADDLLLRRGTGAGSPRDNVVFELGLFVGGLGQDRVFIMHDRAHPPTLPSDLAGIESATFELHLSGNIEAAMGAACTRIQHVIERLGIREQARAQLLSDAAVTVEETSARMAETIRLLARSRRVELDIVAAQFGPLIIPEKLARIREDLHDLEAVLTDEKAIPLITVHYGVKSDRAGLDRFATLLSEIGGHFERVEEHGDTSSIIFNFPTTYPRSVIRLLLKLSNLAPVGRQG